MCLYRRYQRKQMARYQNRNQRLSRMLCGEKSQGERSWAHSMQNRRKH